MSKKKHTHKIAGRLIAGLQLQSPFRGRYCLLQELLIRIFDLRERFGVEVLQERIVGMELALLSKEAESGGAVVFLTEEHADGIFGEG